MSIFQREIFSWLFFWRDYSNRLLFKEVFCSPKSFLTFSFILDGVFLWYSCILAFFFSFKRSDSFLIPSLYSFRCFFFFYYLHSTFFNLKFYSIIPTVIFQSFVYVFLVLFHFWQIPLYHLRKQGGLSFPVISLIYNLLCISEEYNWTAWSLYEIVGTRIIFFLEDTSWIFYFSRCFSPAAKFTFQFFRAFVFKIITLSNILKFFRHKFIRPYHGWFSHQSMHHKLYSFVLISLRM